MITTLHIKNIGIIDEISIDLNKGLNILTGETGAGKTLIIDSLGILCGGRFSKEKIRKGETHSFIELCLYLPEHEKAIEGNIIVSREVYTNGRNLCKINGRMVTVSELKNFMNSIIDIHGQQDNQLILDKNTHVQYLDQWIGNPIKEIQSSYETYYSQYQQIRLELKNHYGDEKEKQRQLDLLQYQWEEIEKAELKLGEEESLKQEQKRMEHAEKIQNALQEAHEQIESNGIESMHMAIRALEKIEQIDPSYVEMLNTLKSVYYDLQELSRDIGDSKQDAYFEETQKKQIEERLDLIYSLKRKYGNSVEEILQYQKETEQQIKMIQNLEQHNQACKEELKKIENNMQRLSEEMHQIREEHAKKLENKMNRELEELEMSNSRFKIALEYPIQTFQKQGKEAIEFLISTNLGEEEKPLIKIASGGEMSRIMLAIKTVLAKVDQAKTLIFDEIDTGISGKAAKAVGEKMKKIAQNHQVICVTHLAVIAAKGDYNYFIHKEVEDCQTRSRVKQLTEKETLLEIARIASGNTSEIAMEHARQLRAS